MVHVALAAAEETGIDAEVIDLRTLVPLDFKTVVASVAHTGACVIVHEATWTCGFGAELAAPVQQHCFYALETPIERVAGRDMLSPPVRAVMALAGEVGEPATIGSTLVVNETEESSRMG